MSDSLNVVALISGGKDSFFSLLHCIRNGHRVIALANLYPPPSPPVCVPSDRDRPLERHGSSIDGHRCQNELELATNEGTDLNSFMYQTVGHSLIPLYSTALQLPLYRRQITGTSVQQSQYYDSSSSTSHPDGQVGVDETEDLVPLLRQVISAHPEANAVSTGAILSTYQRTRVESIAIRLGLTPLSYLWQYPVLPPPEQISSLPPQTNTHRPDSLTGLLEDAASAGLDARIIKIASAGISENLLLANVTDPRTQSRLVKGLSPFFESHDELSLRGAVLGEGGEYETITISGPREVWKGGKIELGEDTNEPYTEEGVTYAKLSKARVVPYNDDEAVGAVDANGSQPLQHRILRPALFDPQFVSAKRGLELSSLDITGRGASKDAVDIPTPDSRSPLYCLPSAETTTCNQQGTHAQNSRPSSSAAAFTVHTAKTSQAQINCSLNATATSISINNLTAASVKDCLSTNIHSTTATVNNGSAMASTTPADQLQKILNHLPSVLARLSQNQSFSLSTANISSASLLLSSISDFASVNPIYSQMYPLGLPNPPARVTIAAPLPSGIDVSLSLTLDLCPHNQRLGLHVQGRSYWAPANIGPYSQAITTSLNAASQQGHGELQSEQDSEPLDEAATSKLQIVYIAGQIPLVPSSMQVHTGSYLDTALLALQHLWRIGQERGVDVWPWGVAYLAESHEVDTSTRVKVSAAVWRQTHIESTWPSDLASDSDDENEAEQSDSDEASNLDIWDIQNNRSLYHGFRQSQISIGKHLRVLPNHSVFKIASSHRRKYIPPYIAAEVIALPRNVSIEWWSNGIAGTTKQSTSPANRSRLEWQTRGFEWGSLSCLTITPNPARPAQTVKFVTCLLSQLSKEDLDDSGKNTPTTISETIRLLESSNSNTLPFSAIHLIQSTAFITTPAFESDTWAHFTSTASGSPNQSDISGPSHQTNFPGNYPGDLISNAAIIPCHRLWGCAASTVPAQARNRTSNESQTGEQRNLDPAIDELSIAFLLRVETM